MLLASMTSEVRAPKLEFRERIGGEGFMVKGDEMVDGYQGQLDYGMRLDGRTAGMSRRMQWRRSEGCCEVRIGQIPPLEGLDGGRYGLGGREER